MNIPDVDDTVEYSNAYKIHQAAVFWKASHDNQVKIKSILIDRPDLGDRAEKISKLISENERLKKENESLKMKIHLLT